MRTRTIAVRPRTRSETIRRWSVRSTPPAGAKEVGNDEGLGALLGWLVPGACPRRADGFAGDRSCRECVVGGNATRQERERCQYVTGPLAPAAACLTTRASARIVEAIWMHISGNWRHRSRHTGTKRLASGTMTGARAMWEDGDS